MTFTGGAGGFNSHPLNSCVQQNGGQPVYGLTSSIGFDDFAFSMQGYPEQGSQHYPKAGTYPPGAAVSATLLVAGVVGSATGPAQALPGGTITINSDGRSGSLSFIFNSARGGTVSATGTFICP